MCANRWIYGIGTLYIEDTSLCSCSLSKLVVRLSWCHKNVFLCQWNMWKSCTGLCYCQHLGTHVCIVYGSLLTNKRNECIQMKCFMLHILLYFRAGWLMHPLHPRKRHATGSSWSGQWAVDSEPNSIESHMQEINTKKLHFRAACLLFVGWWVLLVLSFSFFAEEAFWRVWGHYGS